jgi:uncharacterized protein (TIGR02058 family)
MTYSRLILETGMGNDLYGEDYTKAACRAIQDAIHHSSLTLFRSLDLDSKKMKVNVTIGVAKPSEVDTDLVRKTLPHGVVSVKVVPGGLNIVDPGNGTVSVVASVAIEAFYKIDKRLYRKS